MECYPSGKFACRLRPDASLASAKTTHHSEGENGRDHIRYLENKSTIRFLSQVRLNKFDSSGWKCKRTVRSFAILCSFSSSTSLTSTIVMSFMAGGPVGISIIANHNMGSVPSMLVSVANA